MTYEQGVNLAKEMGVDPDAPHRLTCCCCGSETTGRQWFNRDIGFGVCIACVTRIRARGRTPEEQIKANYGVEGVHYNVTGVPRG